MKIKSLIFLAIATFSMASLQANYYSNNICNGAPCGNNAPSPCATNCCDGSFTDGFSLYGEWLYWKAHQGHLDYGVPDNSDGYALGHTSEICPDYHSGYRVGIAKACGCWLFGVDYTHFSADDSSSFKDATNGDLAGTLIIEQYNVVTQGAIQYAKSSLDLDYDVVRATAGYTCCNCGCLNADIFTGFTYARIDQDRKTLYSTSVNLSGSSNTIDRVKQHWDYKGVGLNFGFAPNYAWNDCINLFGVFSVDAVVGDLDRGFDYYTSSNGGSTYTQQADLKDGCWQIANQLNLAVGINYNFNAGCGCDFDLAVGYEFHQWFNLPGLLVLQNDGGNAITFDRHNLALGFNGLFVRLGTSF